LHSVTGFMRILTGIGVRRRADDRDIHQAGRLEQRRLLRDLLGLIERSADDRGKTIARVEGGIAIVDCRLDRDLFLASQASQAQASAVLPVKDVSGDLDLHGPGLLIVDWVVEHAFKLALESRHRADELRQ